jgi:diguanylate cyclase (GGDEF)-like protein
VAVLDVDHFKRINDTFGHLFGDEVLLLVSRLMREAFRDEDLLFRYGGEEFVAVLAAQGRDGAAAALDRFRERVAAHRFPQLSQVTLSIGFTAMRARELPAAAIARADQALYCAKEEGRNRVCDYDALLAAGRVRAAAAGHVAELF